MFVKNCAKAYINTNLFIKCNVFLPRDFLRLISIFVQNSFLTVVLVCLKPCFGCARVSFMLNIWGVAALGNQALRDVQSLCFVKCFDIL